MKQKIKNLFIILLIISTLIACDETPQEGHIKPTYTMLIGTYTSISDEGIGLLTFDYETGILDATTVFPGIENPSFVITNRAQDIIFAVEETIEGKVKSLSFDRSTNTITVLDEVPSFGAHPCYLSLSPDESILVVGNYSGGNFAAYRVNEGKLTHLQTVQHEGGSVNLARQNQSHVHSAVFHPNGKFLFVNDLGGDKIYIYDFKPNYAIPFQRHGLGYYEVDAGVGPRHLAIHPNGKYLYLVHELTAEIGAYSFSNSSIRKIESYPLTEPTYIGSVGAAEVRMSPDEKFLYVSNRGDANQITSFKIENDGSLEFVERIGTGGITPRNFALTKDGKYLFIAHQDSEDIQVFKRNLFNGKLSKSSFEVKINKPVYLFPLDG